MLAPLLVLPVAFVVDAWTSRLRAGRLVATALVVLVVLAMGSSTVRYLRTVDRLNGLRAMITMTARIVAEPAPVRVEWRGFRNGAAMARLASDLYGARRWNDVSAPVTYVVHNDRPHEGPLPPGGTLHGAVLLERRPPRAATSSTSVVTAAAPSAAR